MEPKENMKLIVKQALNERQSDEDNLEDRKTNIIVFNIPESSATTIESRKSDDAVLFNEICNSIWDSNIPSSEIVQVRRLGARRDDQSNRPLLIKVKSE